MSSEERKARDKQGAGWAGLRGPEGRGTREEAGLPPHMRSHTHDTLTLTLTHTQSRVNTPAHMLSYTHTHTHTHTHTLSFTLVSQTEYVNGYF